MIYIPVFNNDDKEIVSKNLFYCSMCEKWLQVSNSVKNIRRHAAVHLPQLFKNDSKDENTKTLLTRKQNDILSKNIVGFIIFEANSFSLLDSPFLTTVIENLPSKFKLLKALQKISDATQHEIKERLMLSSCSCLAFDEWTDHRNRPFLGVNMRALIHGEYQDFFLDFIHLSEETNDALVLAAKIKRTLGLYGLDVEDILSCTTDNCPLMNRTSIELQLWRIPCVLHIFNLIFQEFVDGIADKIKPIFDIIKLLTNSECYENFLLRKSREGINIQKIPSYVETRWTSFCDSIIILKETMTQIQEIIPRNKMLQPNQLNNLNRLYNICKNYKSTILTYEADKFGASGFLADISLVKKCLLMLKTLI